MSTPTRRDARYTPADFHHAHFAIHPVTGGVASKGRMGLKWVLPGWCDTEDPARLSDQQMAEHGWCPVWECLDRDVHWRHLDLLDELNEVQHQRNEARARADQAERDTTSIRRHDPDVRRALEAVRTGNHLPYGWLGDLDTWQDHATVLTDAIRERDEARADQHHTLGPEDITDEMIERAWVALVESPGWGSGTLREDGPTVRRALTAALTAPPRPEGAEDLQALIDEWADGWGCASDPSEDGNHGPLADFLASRGVRVERSGR